LGLIALLFTAGTTGVGLCLLGGLALTEVQEPRLSMYLLLASLELMEVDQSFPTCLLDWYLCD